MDRIINIDIAKLLQPNTVYCIRGIDIDCIRTDRRTDTSECHSNNGININIGKPSMTMICTVQSIDIGKLATDIAAHVKIIDIEKAD